MPSRRNQKRIGLVAVALAMGGIPLAVFLERHEIRLAWYRWKATEELRPGESYANPDGEAWTQLFDAGPAGYPHMARLLDQDDPQTYFSAVWRIDTNLGSFGRDPQAQFLEYMRAKCPVKFLRFLLVEPYGQNAGWRCSGSDPADFEYWCGEGSERLPPSQELLDFCDGVLAGRGKAPADIPHEEFGDCNLERRALCALGAMLLPGQAARQRAARVEPHSLSRKVLDRLEEIATTCPRPAIRHHAIGVLLSRSRPAVPWEWTSLEKWEDVIEALRGFPPKRGFGAFDRLSYLSLRYLDHPRSLRILAWLDLLEWRNPDFLQALSLQEEDAPLDIPLRKRGTWIEGAARFLAGTPSERYGAAMVIAELGLGEAAPLLRDRLSTESIPEVQIGLRAALLALGDRTQQQTVEAELRKRTMARRVASWMTFLWESAEVQPSDLARCLLWAGDVRILERLVGFVVDGNLPLLLDLKEFMDFQEDWHLATPDARELPELREELKSWWSECRDRISWNPRTRVYVIKSELGK